MSTTPNLLTLLPSLRIRAGNENHHLWNNHGTWFLHYTVHPTPVTKERIRRSLGTRDVAVARERRDTFLAHLARETATGLTGTRHLLDDTCTGATAAA